MFGDFSRDSFDPSKHYTRVLMQQGRPLTDADWNEMVELLVREQRELVVSLVGWHGTSDGGFELLSTGNGAYRLQAGTYYVDGLLCRNECDSNPFNLPPILTVDSDVGLIYLDTWDETISAADDGSLIDPAMPAVDTAVRSRVNWAVRAVKTSANLDPSTNRADLIQVIKGPSAKAQPASLEARIVSTKASRPGNDACEMRAGQTSGVEQVYRIEVHQSAITPTATPAGGGAGAAAGAAGAPIAASATVQNPELKWSRSNGITAHPVREILGNQLMLAAAESVGRSIKKQFKPGAWIELVDKNGLSASKDRALLKITDVHDDSVTVEGLTQEGEKDVLAHASAVHASSYFIRQWDQNADLSPPTVKVTVVGQNPNANDGWVRIENGLEIRVLDTGYCLEGDYWLLRVSSGGRVHFSRRRPVNRNGNSVECAEAVRAHHFAPLGKITKSGSTLILATPYRIQLKLLGNPDPARSVFGPCPNTTNPAPTAGPGADPAAIVAPETCSIPLDTRIPSPISLLSGEGAKALKGYFATPQDLTRRVFARHLNHKHEPKSPRYQKYRSALLLSEILETSFEKYFAKVDRCLSLSDSEKAVAEADARADYALAVEFERTLLSGDGSRSRLA